MTAQGFCDVSTSTGMPRIARNFRGKEKGMEQSPPKPFERPWPCQNLDLEFLASRTVRENVSVVLSRRV